MENLHTDKPVGAEKVKKHITDIHNFWSSLHLQTENLKLHVI